MVKQRNAKRADLLRKFAKLLAVWIFPLLYKSYMRIVYHTSRKTEIEFSTLWEMTARGENVLGAIWHQDAFISPFCHRGHDFHAMVSHSSLGNIATEILRKCDVTAIRGGSARGGKEALAEIIDYMNTHTGVLCGITVDGSRGPAYRVHRGIMHIAKATGAPIYPARSWAKRKVFAPTWDRTMIPLPFNHLLFILGEPMHVPEDASGTMLEILRMELERRLNELVAYSAAFFQHGAKRVSVGISRT